MAKHRYPEYIYHYTNFLNFISIYDDQTIKPSCSNLLPCDKDSLQYKQVSCRGHKIGVEPFDNNSVYKPVVWFTSNPNISDINREVCALPSHKTDVRLSVKFDKEKFISWKKFADSNKMDPDWRYSVERGMQHKNFYVYEGSLPYSDIVEIKIIKEYQPIYDKLLNGDNLDNFIKSYAVKL